MKNISVLAAPGRIGELAGDSSATPSTASIKAVPGGRAIIAGLVLLVVGVGIDRYGVEVGGTDFRFELLIGLVLALVWVLRAGPKSALAALRSVGIVEVCLFAWLVLSFVSSIFFSPMRADSLKLTVLIAGFLMLYGVGFVLMRSRRAVLWGVTAWIAVGAGVALVGFIAAFLYIIFGWTAGVTLEGNYLNGAYTVTPKVHGTLWEPNLFGSFCLSVGVMALALSFAREYSSPRARLMLRSAAVCAFCGVMLSMTRTLWAVTPVVLALLFVSLWWKLAEWRSLLAGVLLPALLGTFIGLALGFAMPVSSLRTDQPLTGAQEAQVLQSAQQRGSNASSPTLLPTAVSGATAATPTPQPVQGSALSERLGTLAHSGEVSSLVGRQRIFALALKGWEARPLFGWGTGSFAAYDTGNDKWVGNLELHVLFDTGALGLLLLALAVFFPVKKALVALRSPAGSWSALHFALLGLLVAGVGLFLAYQTTEGLWLGFTWVYFAMLTAAARYLPAGVSAATTAATASNSEGSPVAGVPSLSTLPVMSGDNVVAGGASLQLVGK